eukprot:313414-Prorocentrum_minimum.AAC.1
MTWRPFSNRPYRASLSDEEGEEGEEDEEEESERGDYAEGARWRTRKHMEVVRDLVMAGRLPREKQLCAVWLDELIQSNQCFEGQRRVAPLVSDFQSIDATVVHEGSFPHQEAKLAEEVKENGGASNEAANSSRPN